ncbi:MAG: 30S ribosomal protein S13 [Dehalococcoidia bacterium]|nr:30S ribosomal protein S13 [Dehalococcoidia bacterium]
MAIIAGINLPDTKRVHIALRYIYGIGPTNAVKATRDAGVQGNPKMREITDEQLTRLREAVAKYKVEGDLRREVQSNIRRKIDIRSYQGIRHSRGLPLRGQRTKTNARTRKGPRKTVAGRAKAAAKK